MLTVQILYRAPLLLFISGCTLLHIRFWWISDFSFGKCRYLKYKTCLHCNMFGPPREANELWGEIPLQTINRWWRKTARKEKNHLSIDSTGTRDECVLPMNKNRLEILEAFEHQNREVLPCAAPGWWGQKHSYFLRWGFEQQRKGLTWKKITCISRVWLDN